MGVSLKVCDFWDVFCFRGNKQDEFLEKFIFNTNKGRKKNQINLFGLKQIVLLLKYIELCEPKVIVFPNKGAVDRLVEIFKLCGKEVGFNERLGTHYIKIKGIKYPIFFSSNLHLQNRLDRYSQDRLGWHVKWVFNQVEYKRI